MIKMMGWEAAYADRLRGKRAVHLRRLIMMRRILNLILMIGRSAAAIGTLCTVIGLALARGEVRHLLRWLSGGDSGDALAGGGDSAADDSAARRRRLGDGGGSPSCTVVCRRGALV